MQVLVPLMALVFLVVLPWAGVSILGLRTLFGVVVPYAGGSVLLVGIVWRVLEWAAAPVPFRIPTTCGQQKSLPWIRSGRLDNPHNNAGVAGRVVLEVLAFRSLFRNSKVQRTSDGRLAYGSGALLWLAALMFHYSMLVILVRHFRLFVEPVPAFVTLTQRLDGFLEVGTPRFYLTGGLIIAALCYLLLRRLADPRVRYLSLPADFFSLFLLLGVALSGILMSYLARVDLVTAKELVMGLAAFRLPSREALQGVGTVFYVHLFLASVLAAWFPMSKLMHMAGIFLSPTRNLANNNRSRRHVNPWDHPVPVHTYGEWEDEFREKLREAGLPLESQGHGPGGRG